MAVHSNFRREYGTVGIPLVAQWSAMQEPQERQVLSLR